VSRELADYWRMLSLVSIRRLFALRHHPAHGAEARAALRGWVRTYRAVTP